MYQAYCTGSPTAPCGWIGHPQRTELSAYSEGHDHASANRDQHQIWMRADFAEELKQPAEQARLHTARVLVQSIANHPGTDRRSADYRALKRTAEILQRMEEQQ
jgi:hypothetical protein